MTALAHRSAGTGARVPGPALRTRLLRGLQARLYVAPAALLLAVLLYLPFLYTLYISFTTYNGLGSPTWAGISNYLQFVHNAVFWVTVSNTLIWVVGTIVLPVGIGLLVAVLTHQMKGGTWFRLPFLIPYALSGASVAVVWGFILQPDGPLNSLLGVLHLPGAHTTFLADRPLNTIVMLVASTWQGVGVNALLFVVGLQSIPREPLEAARLDGASGWRMFRYMTWPLLRPLATVVIGLAIVASLKTFDIVWVMTAGGPGRSSETLAVTMYRDTFVATQYGLGSAVAVILTVVAALASVMYLRRQLAPARSVT